MDENPTPTTLQAPQPAPKPVKFVHRMLPSFRGVHADGVWATINGQKFIQLNFFSEQPTVPDFAVFPVNAAGNYTGEQELPSEDPKYFIVNRDIQVGVTLSIQTATQLRVVLDNFIAIAQKQETERK